MSYQIYSVQAVFKANRHPMRQLKVHLRSLNKEQAESISGEIYAELYWFKRDP